MDGVRSLEEEIGFVMKVVVEFMIETNGIQQLLQNQYVVLE